ncbi:MAG: hypothetical protein ACE5HV_02410 [Acidobacteriota bacterium]
MRKLLRVYLPRWTGWFVTVLLVPVWLLVTWAAFFSPDPDDRLPLPAYLLVCGIFGVILVVVWLLASRRVPAYLIEMEVDERSEEGR